MKRHPEALLERGAPFLGDGHRHDRRAAGGRGRGRSGGWRKMNSGMTPSAIGHRRPGRAHLLQPARRAEALGHDRLGARDEAAEQLHEQRIGVEERHADEVAIGLGTSARASAGPEANT